MITDLRKRKKWLCCFLSLVALLASCTHVPFLVRRKYPNINSQAYLGIEEIEFGQNVEGYNTPDLHFALNRGLGKSGLFRKIEWIDKYQEKEVDFILKYDVKELTLKKEVTPVIYYPTLVLFWTGVVIGAGIPGLPFSFIPQTSAVSNVDIEIKCIETATGETLFARNFGGEVEFGSNFWYFSKKELENLKMKILGDVVNEVADQFNRAITTRGIDLAQYHHEKPSTVSIASAQSLPLATRDEPVPSYSASGVGLRWAVVIGISKYKNAGPKLPNIRYADNDAEAFYKFLISKKGGRLPQANTRLLLNEDATYQNMREALFEFLKQAIEEDIVYVYFSGHGSPEPGNRDNLYLLPYDTDPDKIASTAFPMRDVEAALTHHIKAKRVLVFADACHSGGIGGDFGTKGVVVQGNTINRFFKMLSEVRPGRVIITASEAEEVSREGEKWGGGHGVFTYHLLEGISGKADFNGDKIVTLGEALMYTDEKVRRDTNSEQHPVVTGKIDMTMPLAVLE